MRTTKVKAHKRKGKKVSAHNRKLGVHLRAVHAVGKEMHGKEWMNVAKKCNVMGFAHACIKKGNTPGVTRKEAALMLKGK